MKYSKRKLLLATLTTVTAVSIFALAAIGCAPRADSSDGPDGSSEVTGVTDAPFDWSIQSDCSICHTAEASAVTDSAHAQAVAHAELGCVSCHTEEPVLAAAHAGVSLADKPATKPTVITVSEQACVSCHGDLSQVAELTADSQALRDDQGLVVNPHQRPEGASHDANPATCTSCHNNHSETLARDAKKYCASCHHRGIWQCGTCHEKRD